MTKTERQLVFDKYNGRCAYCGCELSNKWQVDHAISKHLFFFIDPMNPKCVDTFENLMPSCVPCNHYKRALCIEQYGNTVGFRNYMLSFHKRLAKLPKKTKIKRTEKRKQYMMIIAENYGITENIPFNGKFYFETVKAKEDGNTNSSY